jgi:hypothetical protein
MTQNASAPVVERIDARRRYAILVGGKTAGFTAYRDRDGQRASSSTRKSTTPSPARDWPHSSCTRP